MLAVCPMKGEKDLRVYWRTLADVAGSLDGTRAGIFYVPIVDPPKMSVAENLFLHEAIPGLHFRISLQQENTSFPTFRRATFNSAFAEGWGYRPLPGTCGSGSRNPPRHKAGARCKLSYRQNDKGRCHSYAKAVLSIICFCTVLLFYCSLTTLFLVRRSSL
jgi:hypothetical protein